MRVVKYLNGVLENEVHEVPTHPTQFFINSELRRKGNLDPDDLPLPSNPMHKECELVMRWLHEQQMKLDMDSLQMKLERDRLVDKS